MTGRLVAKSITYTFLYNGLGDRLQPAPECGMQAITANKDPVVHAFRRLRGMAHTVLGTSFSISFVTDVLGRLTMMEENPGLVTTAYSLLAEFSSAVRTTVQFRAESRLIHRVASWASPAVV